MKVRSLALMPGACVCVCLVLTVSVLSVVWGSITVQQVTWGKSFHCRTSMSDGFHTAVCNVSGIFLTNMYRRTCTLNFTILFIQLIANLLAHYLLSADDSCECIQACILGWNKKGKQILKYYIDMEKKCQKTRQGKKYSGEKVDVTTKRVAQESGCDLPRGVRQTI